MDPWPTNDTARQCGQPTWIHFQSEGGVTRGASDPWSGTECGRRSIVGPSEEYVGRTKFPRSRCPSPPRVLEINRPLTWERSPNEHSWSLDSLSRSFSFYRERSSVSISCVHSGPKTTPFSRGKVVWGLFSVVVPPCVGGGNVYGTHTVPSLGEKDPRLKGQTFENTILVPSDPPWGTASSLLGVEGFLHWGWREGSGRGFPRRGWREGRGRGFPHRGWREGRRRGFPRLGWREDREQGL